MIPETKKKRFARCYQQLEPRLLLVASLSTIGDAGGLFDGEIIGSHDDDSIQVELVGGTLRVTDPEGVSAGGLWIQVSPTVGEIPLGSITGGDIFVRGGGGDDVIDATNADVVLRIFGDAGDDVILGGPNSQRIEGGTGSDTISGGDGDDHLLGGDDADVLDGQRG